MVSNGKRKGTVRFLLAPGCSAKRVAIAGDFSDWQPLPLRRRDDGYAVSLALPAGTYQYKFIVDGAWITDPDNNQWALSTIGTMNSVVVVD
ncbi:MAG: glycogen-binding domain-containing protein [Planctomycetota bacterium]|jgi:1,4-alpha-glucan branching enzyme